MWLISSSFIVWKYVSSDASRMRRFAWPLILLACVAACARGERRRGADVLTQHGDAARTGVTDPEPRLRPELLTPQTFGRLYVRKVDGGIVAQPLFIKDVPTARHGRRDLLLVATETNWVYAFDVNDQRADPATPPLAARQLEATGRVRPAICDETPSQRVGITATPVVDPATHRLYAVARNADDHQYVLHALDLTADLADARPPVRIAAEAGGARFDAECQRNRPALLLAGGVVYAAFGSLGCDRDCGPDQPYRGWVMGWRAADLASAGVFCTSPEPTGHAGIWQGGGGLAAAADRIFFQTGNGPGPLGDAFVALTAPALELAPVHRPANHAALDRADVDLGSGAPVWLPPGVLLGAGKEGRFALLDAASLAPVQDDFQAFANSYHADASAPACGALVRSAFPTNCDTAVPGCYIDPARYQNGEDCGPNVNGGPVFWPDAGADFGLVLQMAGRDFLKSFRYDPRARRLDPRPFAVSPVRAVEGMSGGFATLSADGGRNAILWISYPLGDPQWQNVPGRLAAFDPLTLRELWHDDGGELFAKFTAPTIADGRVVRATLSGRIVVYGLHAEPARGLVPRIAAFFRPRPFVAPPLVGRAAVDEKYRLAGGETGFLGAPAFDARPVQDRAQGWYRDFHGVIVGAVPATISARHLPPGTPPAPGHRPWSGLGTPFASSIYWSAATGAHILTAEIRDAWLATGGPTGPLGYPTSDEAPAHDGGRAAEFQSGRIVWTAQTGARIAR
ncbi:MAG: LGFP repeat-containing protein [Polyangia bacterium]